MLHPSSVAGRTFWVQAAQGGFAFKTVGGAAAFRAIRRQHKGPFRTVSPLREHPHHRRYHISSLLDHDPVPNADILFKDIVLIVQGRTGNDRACHLHRIELCPGCDDPSAPNVDGDLPEGGLHLLRRKFIGHRPAGTFCPRPQLCPLIKAIHFYDHAVNVKRQMMSFLLRLGQNLQDFLKLSEAPAVADLEAQGRQLIQCLFMRACFQTAAEEIEHENIKRPRSSDFAVQLAQRASSSVSWVGESLEAV